MHDVVIVGGGPSGLAAAHEAAGWGARLTVVERLDRVGGLARTLDFEGSRFDVGPHRFFTKNREIHALFVETVGEDLIHVARRTRILHDGRYFDYPLTPVNAFLGVGVRSSWSILSSYLAARARRVVRPRPVETFEDWIIDRFGRRLYESFFRSYTEKVWGIPCARIGAEWAAQRIRALSLRRALAHAFSRSRRTEIATLVDRFVYPRLGAGQVYEKMAGLVTAAGGDVTTGAAVRTIRREGRRVRAVVVDDGRGGLHDVEGRSFLVSVPLTDMVAMMRPPAPPEVRDACRHLRYRQHVGVNLLVAGDVFSDNWIYVHSRDVAMARVTNYRNFSPAMAGRAGLSPITVEYFTFADGELWSASDEALIARSVRELAHVRILTPDQVVGGFVVRSVDAYPVVDVDSARHVRVIKAWLDHLENLLPIGRAGMFKYNNQDHAMATGVLAARTVLGLRRFDPWLVNVDAEYQEDAARP